MLFHIVIQRIMFPRVKLLETNHSLATTRIPASLRILRLEPA